MRILVLFATLSGIFILSNAVLGQSRITVVGCYSDVSPIPEGEVVGNGTFRIVRENGKYSATFSELISDSGEHAAPKLVENLRINRQSGLITFDLPLDRGGKPVMVRNVSGKISKRGIKMNWRGDHGEYGESNPFLRRRFDTCNRLKPRSYLPVPDYDRPPL